MLFEVIGGAGVGGISTIVAAARSASETASVGTTLLAEVPDVLWSSGGVAESREVIF